MQLSEREMRRVRGREIGLVLQSPLSALNPAMRIGRQLSEAWHAHASDKTEDCQVAIREALHSVSLPSDYPFLRRYPAQLSVGQAQRLLIAIAIIHRPALLIADEPTSALDVITQAEILALFRQLNRTRGVSILYISHDLVSVAGICDRVAILHEGEIVECAPTEQIFDRPKHPYTKMLIAALPGFVTRNSPGIACRRRDTRLRLHRGLPARLPSESDPARWGTGGADSGSLTRTGRRIPLAVQRTAARLTACPPLPSVAGRRRVQPSNWL